MPVGAGPDIIHTDNHTGPLCSHTLPTRMPSRLSCWAFGVIQETVHVAQQSDAFSSDGLANGHFLWLSNEK